MDERSFERIEKYLRKEMSVEESILFEQEVLGDSELQKEIELTYRIKKSLTDRQKKLYKTAHWENKRKYKIISFTAISSIVAVFVIGLVFVKPMLDNHTNSDFVTSAGIIPLDSLREISEEAIVAVKKSISEGKEEVAIAEVNRLEEKNVIPTLNDVSEGHFVMSHSVESEDTDILSRDAYELHWLKICSLIKIGKKDEAKMALLNFVSLDGKYKSQADSMLISLSQK